MKNLPEATIDTYRHISIAHLITTRGVYCSRPYRIVRILITILLGVTSKTLGTQIFLTNPDE